MCQGLLAMTSGMQSSSAVAAKLLCITLYCSLYHNPEHAYNAYKRHITPLTEPEYKSTYLFADPAEADASRQRHTALQMSQTTLS